VWVFVLALAVVGCARTTLKDSVADTHGGRGGGDELDFWDGAATKPMVSNRDALHALVVSFVPGDEATDHAAELTIARRRGWVAEGEALPAGESARIGWIARAVCLECGIRGGVTMRVFGAKERYAVRELNYLGWLPEMSTFQAISGAKLIALLGSAEDYRNSAAPRPKEDL
jgi:hypothetical protein